jgi:hypothetical protein
VFRKTRFRERRATYSDTKFNPERREQNNGTVFIKRGLGREERYIHTQNDTRKEQARIMGKCLEKRGISIEEIYLQTQNDSRKGASKVNGKLLRETRDK